MSKLLKFVGSLILAFGAAALGSFATTPYIQTWYAAINKPGFNPPNWIFGPVWTLLFFLMAVSAYLVWQKGLENKKVRSALTVYLAQLGFNVLWSLVFFTFHSPFGAYAIIIVLWILILTMIIRFYRILPLAGILQIPYLLWVTFASFLNLSIALLNR